MQYIWKNLYLYICTVDIAYTYVNVEMPSGLYVDYLRGEVEWSVVTFRSGAAAFCDKGEGFCGGRI